MYIYCIKKFVFIQVGGSNVLMLRKWTASVNESDHLGKQNGTVTGLIK